MEYASEEINRRFAEGAKAYSERARTQEEWTKRGATLLKRRALGFCGKTAVKSLEEMASILFELKITDSLEKGKDMVRELYGRFINYDGGSLYFENATTPSGKESCRIRGEPAPWI